MANRLVVFGSGGHAQVVLDAVLVRTRDRDVIVLDDDPAACGKKILGFRVSGSRDLLAELSGATVMPAIGNNSRRSEIMSWLEEEGHRLESVIHPAATISPSATVGPGAFVAAGAVVNPEATIGPGAIVNTGATVDHDCVIGSAAHVAPGVHLCGEVHIGARTLGGVGASVRPGISISNDVTIGAGSVVVRDIAEIGVYAGSPARRLR